MSAAFPEPANSEPRDVLTSFKLRAYDFSDDLFEALALLPDVEAEQLHDSMLAFCEALPRKLTANTDVLGSLNATTS